MVDRYTASFRESQHEVLRMDLSAQITPDGKYVVSFLPTAIACAHRSFSDFDVNDRVLGMLLLRLICIASWVNTGCRSMIFFLFSTTDAAVCCAQLKRQVDLPRLTSIQPSSLRLYTFNNIVVHGSQRRSLEPFNANGAQQ